MTRDEAYKLVKEHLGETATFAHCLACEACMRALAEKLGKDVEMWGLTGLVHDLDLEICQGDAEKHALVGAEVLREHGVDEAVVHAVLGHNDKVERTELMDKAMWVVDPTTGMITAAALIRPSKSTSDLKIKSVKKRMKDKRFAAAVNRDQIRACEEQLGLELGEFLTICLQAMDSIRDDIGLGG
ncbi:MAG: HDIG domain-containing protein [Proteobacteria bacterium]|nr:HDIG domain-containing protein [Pseudomonadota bacterium]